MHASRPMQNLGGYPLRDRLRGEGLKAGARCSLCRGRRKPFVRLFVRHRSELRTGGTVENVGSKNPA